jgi:hypothetical protein
LEEKSLGPHYTNEITNEWKLLLRRMRRMRRMGDTNAQLRGTGETQGDA